MVRRAFVRPIATLLIACASLLAIDVVPALATHFRGGYFEWERLSSPTPGVMRVRLTMRANLRWGYPSYPIAIQPAPAVFATRCTAAGGGCCVGGFINSHTSFDLQTQSCPNIGSLVSLGSSIVFNKSVTIIAKNGFTLVSPIAIAAGGPHPLDMVPVQVIPSQDVMYAQATWDLEFQASTATPASPLTAVWASNARLSSLLDGNRDTSWSLITAFDGSPEINRSPRSSSVPVIPVFVNVENTVDIPLQAFDNLLPRIRVATATESGLVAPTPLTLNGTTFSLNTQTGRVQFRPAAAGLYAVQFVITSVSAAGVESAAKVPMEILFQAIPCVGSCTTALTVSTADTQYTTTVGAPIDIPITVTSSPLNPQQTITLNNPPLPPDVQLIGSQTGPASAPLTRILRWLPTVSSTARLLCFDATLQQGQLLVVQSQQRCLTLTPAALATALAMSPVSAAAGDTVTLQATLTRVLDSQPLSTRNVTFAWADAPQTPLATVLTNTSGVASHTFQLTQVTPPGGRQMTATFNAIAGELLASTSTQAAVIVRSNSTTINAPVVTTPSIGMESPISAVLNVVTTAGGGPVAGQDGVTFTITGPGGFVQVLPGSTTNAAGVSTASGFVPPNAGPFTVTASFPGNANLLGNSDGSPVSASTSVTALQRVKLEVTPSQPTVFAGSSTSAQPITITTSLTQLPSGSPIGGRTVTVNFGTGATPASLTTTTNSTGTITAQVIYTSTGTKTLTASTSLLAGEADDAGNAVATETATASVAAQAASSALTEDLVPQSASSGGAYMASVFLRRTSPVAGPISGVTVTFTFRTPTNGLAGQRTGVTDASGRALMSTPFTITAQMLGASTVTITAPATTTEAVPTALIIPITVSAQPSTVIAALPVNAVATVPSSFAVSFVDAGGTPLAGLTGISVSGVPGLTSVTPQNGVSQIITNAAGQITVSLTPAAAGSSTYTIAYDGTGGRVPAADQNTITVRKANTQLTLISPTGPQTLPQGSQATVQVRLQRNEGTLVPLGSGQTVMFTLTRPGGSTTQHAVVTDGSGLASFNYTLATLGTYAVTAAYEGTATVYNAAGTISAAPVTVADTTAPIITPTVTGTLGANNWYTSNVSVSWNVSDPDSAITSQTGCDAVVVSTDSASHSLTCTAESGGGSSSQTVTFKRDATPPSLTTSANVSVTATSAQGNTVSYDAAVATDDVSGATVNCVPPSGGLFPLGSTPVSCTATNGAGLTTVAGFTVAVTNAPPTATDDVATTDEDAMLNGSVLGNDTDIENATLTAVLVSGPSHGALQFNADGSFTYTPAANYFGSDSFTYRANDGVHNSNIAIVTITVNSVNDAPSATGGALAATEDTAATGTLTGNDLESTALTFAIVSNGGKGSAQITNAATGAFTYTPNLNANGADAFTFTVSDGTANSVAATIAVTIAPVNDAPTVEAGTLDATEDTPANGTLAAADVDGDELIYTVVSNGAKGSVIADAWTGAFVYTPNANANGTDSFTFKVNDGTVDSALATVTVTIAATNDAPAANGGTLSATEDVQASGTLTGSDLDLDALSFSIVDNGGKGVVQITNAATGAFTYTPNANANGTDSFTFKVNDGNADSAPATITVTIAAVNDAPSANAAAVTTDEDVVVTGTLSGADLDNDAITFAIAGNGTKGVATITDAATGAFSYAPNANATGTDSFTFIVNDGTVDSASATVTVTITAVNDAPSADAGTLSATEDTPVNGTLSGSDLDADALSFVLVDNGGKGVVQITNAGTGAFTYTPNANANGTDSFTFKVNDGNADSATATITVTIAAVNDAPSAAAATMTTDEDTVATGTLSGADLDNDAITFAIAGNGAKGVATITDASTGAFSYAPNANATGTDSFTFIVNDGTVDSASATVTVTIAAVNDAPSADAGTLSATEDTAANGTLSGSDLDADVLSFAIAANGAKGTAVITNPATGAFTYTPNANSNGTDSFTFTVNDGTVSSATATVSVTIAPINDAPSATGDAAATSEDTPVTGNVLGNDTDVDGDTLSAVLVSSTSHGAVTLAPNGGFTYTPNANFHGTDAFTYKPNDGAADGGVVTVTIVVSPVNDAPTASNGALAATEDTAAGGTLSGGDVDGNPLTYSILSNGTKGTAVITNPATGAFTYTPSANANGADTFTFKVNDGTVDSAPATIAVTIAAVNDAPTAGNDSATLPQNEVVNIPVLANDSDVEGSALTPVIVANPTRGTVTVNADGTVRYRPNNGYRGNDSFTYRARDGALNSNVATVSITVTRTNRAPNASNDAVTINEDAVANGNVLTNDTDADNHTLTAVLVSGPDDGTLVLNPNGSFTYTPAPNFNGTDRFRYRASDGFDESGQTTVTITVRSVNDAPIAQNDATTASGALPAIGNVLANDSDVDSNNITAVLVTPPAHGTVTLNSNGLFTYRANAGYSGPDSFTYQARDGSASSNVAVVAVTVQSAAQAVAQSIAVLTSIDPSLADEIDRILNPVPPRNSCQAGVQLAQIVITSPAYSLVEKVQMLVAVTRITATVGCN